MAEIIGQALANQFSAWPQQPDSGNGPTFPQPMTVKAMAAYQAGWGLVPLPATCPECGGTGWLRPDVAYTHPDFGKPYRCPICSEGARCQWLLDHCGLVGEQLRVTLADWRPGAWRGDPQGDVKISQRSIARTAMGQAIKERSGLYTFWGDFGAGKTLALSIIANELRAKDTEVFYAPFALLLEHLRSLARQGEAWSAFWQRLVDIPVLCIDEVTRFNETPWARERLFMLADTRYIRRGSHLTCFATNDDPRPVLSTSEDIGYLYSRLRHGTLIELTGDMREADK